MWPPKKKSPLKGVDKETHNRYILNASVGVRDKMKSIVFIKLTLKFKQEGEKWTAFCEELGTATFDYSLPEAKKRIKEAVLLHLNTLEDVGECEHFFTEHNIKVYEHRPKRSELTISTAIPPDTYATPYVYPIHRELLGI